MFFLFLPLFHQKISLILKENLWTNFSFYFTLGSFNPTYLNSLRDLENKHKRNDKNKNSSKNFLFDVPNKF